MSMKDIERRLDVLEEKMDKVTEINQSQEISLGKMTTILEGQHESLKEHIMASKSNGERLFLVETQAVKDRSFIKGSMYGITAFWTLAAAVVGLYIKFGG